MYLCSTEEYDGINEMIRKRVVCDKTPTASIINGKLHLNQNWWASLDSDQRIAVLRHEYKHMQYNKIPIDTTEIMTHGEVDQLLDEVNNLIHGKCECGKDKHGFIFHSTWCPK